MSCSMGLCFLVFFHNGALVSTRFNGVCEIVAARTNVSGLKVVTAKGSEESIDSCCQTRLFNWVSFASSIRIIHHMLDISVRRTSIRLPSQRSHTMLRQLSPEPSSLAFSFQALPLSQPLSFPRLLLFNDSPDLLSFILQLIQSAAIVELRRPLSARNDRWYAD